MLIIDRREGTVRGHGACRPGSLLALLRRWALWSQSGRISGLWLGLSEEGPKWGGGWRVGVVQGGVGWEKSRVDETGKTRSCGRGGG